MCQYVYTHPVLCEIQPIQAKKQILLFVVSDKKVCNKPHFLQGYSNKACHSWYNKNGNCISQFLVSDNVLFLCFFGHLIMCGHNTWFIKRDSNDLFAFIEIE